MGTLYIDRKDVELHRDGACISLYERGERSGSIPFSQLERVVTFNRVVLDTRLLCALAGYGVSLVALNSRHPEQTVYLPGRAHNDASRRISQYRLSLDEAWRTRWSVILVKRKLLGQRAFLARSMGTRPEVRHALFVAVQQISERIVSLSGQRGRDSIRGIEGAGASSYFRGYCALFAPELGFTGRNRRPPKDPVNSCLSLAYTLAHADAAIACHAAGLDPLIGFFHDLSFARESLACDLAEPLRPRVDSWVWSLFRSKTLRPDHFTLDKGACLLGKAGRREFYVAWEAFAPQLRRRLRAYTRLLVHALERETIATVDDTE